ncbi:MAG: GNAT family N-acetyltransferase [Acidimicrobiia bacterium]|nr:GNAT family N-acetyltransferase [Acidimicrobiia bacterium]
MTGFAVWGPERVGELLALTRTRYGADELSVDELLLSCHERGGVVLGADGMGAVAVAVGRSDDGALVASVRLVVTHAPSPEDLDPLLDAAERWAADRSAARVVLGGGLPFALWPGVPVGSIVERAAVGRGYENGRRWTSWRVPSTFRAEPPAGVTIRRAVRDDDVTLVMVAAAASWPRRSDEIARALEHGTCHVAVASPGGADTVVGIATHSIARAGWTGPLIVGVGQRRRGVGRALLGQVCRDLMIAEFDEVIVGEVPDDGAVAFLRAVGAAPGESFVALERPI